MPKTIFTVDEIASFTEHDPKRHMFYEQAVEIAESMCVHANGEYPKKLIEERRPHESELVTKYREKIWKPMTKSVFTKVFSELQKIRKSSDWSVKYERLDEFTKIREEESLEEYCENEYPYFRSLTNWCFSDLLRQILIDPNGVVVVKPIEKEIEVTGFLKPFANLYGSKQIIKFVPEDYLVLRLDEACEYRAGNTTRLGRSIVIVTTIEFLRYDQIDDKGTFDLVEQWNHGLNMLPVVPLTGVLIKSNWPQFLYESRIAGMIPYLDEAIREYSDLQAAKVLHIHPERWEFIQRECPDCRGTGVIPNPKWHEGCDASVSPTCGCVNSECIGGYLANGPYSKLIVRPVNNATEGGSQLPNPPAGYIEKDVQIVKLMDEGIRQHKYDALAAINFEFLAETPLNQSGKAKEVDSEALNNTVHSIAEDIVAVMDKIMLIIATYRYSALYSLDEIQEMLPTINVPERFDILGSSRIMTEIASAKTNDANPIIKSALEIDYAAKRFNGDQDIYDFVTLVLSLDPLQNISEDAKMSRLSNKGITLESYVISSNIEEFVKRALEEEEDFGKWPANEQREVLKKYAQEVVESNEPKENQQIIDTALNDPRLNEDFADDEESQNQIPNNGGEESSTGDTTDDQQSNQGLQ